MDLFLDVRRGATAEGLLGALIDAGASLEEVEAAVAALGRGDVRLQLQAAPGGAGLRVRAPQGAPVHRVWGDLRPRIALLAVDDEVVDIAVAVLDALFAARGRVHGVPAAEMDLDPLSGIDDVAEAVALAAATCSLAPDRTRTSRIGHGTGTMRTIEGDIALPGPVVGDLLADQPTDPMDVTDEVVDPVGAAYLLVVGDAQGQDVPDWPVAGRGRLPGGGVLRALLAPGAGPHGA